MCLKEYFIKCEELIYGRIDIDNDNLNDFYLEKLFDYVSEYHTCNYSVEYCVKNFINDYFEELLTCGEYNEIN